MSESTTHEAILRDLLAGPADLRRLTRKHGVALEELAQVLDAPATMALLRIFTLAGDASAAIAISRARHSAISALKKIASDTDNPEPARKASVDLLKTAPATLTSPLPKQTDESQPTDLDDATQALIRQALAAFKPQPPEADA